MDLDRILDGRDPRWSVMHCGLVVVETLRKVGKTGGPLKQKRYDRKTVYRTVMTYYSPDGEVLQGWVEIDGWLAEHPKDNYQERLLRGIADFVESVKEIVRKKTQCN